jgi:hypothetical protein
VGFDAYAQWGAADMVTHPLLRKGGGGSIPRLPKYVAFDYIEGVFVARNNSLYLRCGNENGTLHD